ncbi:MAG TPA: hypothetical protein VGF95_14510 [Solirubrobacteraceae bacterium]|jgi:hypothetical protein
MSQDLVSSVPGIVKAFLGLTKTAAEEQEPTVPVFAFQLGQYEPAGFVILERVVGPRFAWETIGAFSQREVYELQGKATVFSGDSPATNPALFEQVMTETYALFQAVVMTPVMSNRTMPILGTEGPSPFEMLPQEAHYEAGPAEMAGGQAGFYGQVEWAFQFSALLTPA